jgi:NADPH:quinone reductase-like Zn-dependent oxidoreductase
MRAILVREYGGPDVMRLEDVERPKPGPGEILVKVRAVTVNRTRDLTIAEGRPYLPETLPLIPGMDPAGEVAALGAGVVGFVVGDPVAVTSRSACGTCRECRRDDDGDCADATHIGIHRWGGYAEYVSVPAQNCIPIPDGVDTAKAAVLLRHFPTAFQLLEDKAALEPGESVLVMGAAGGLGGAGIQAAKLMRATVIAGAGTPERVEVGLRLGADHGIDYRAADLTEEVMRLTGGRGVDVVFENISDPTTWPKAFASLAYGGRLVTAGAHGGGTVPADMRQLYLKRLRILGAAGAGRRNLERTLAVADRVEAPIDEIMPLEALHEAYERLADGNVTGKLVIDPWLGRA